MKNPINRKYISIGIVAFLVIVASILFFYVCFSFNKVRGTVDSIIGILKPVIYGFIIAYLLTPITNYFERRILFPFELRNKDSITVKRKKTYRVCSIILTILLISLIVTIFVKSVFPELGKSIRILSVQFPAYVESIQQFANSLLSKNQPLLRQIESLINIKEEDIYNYVYGTLFPNIQNILTNFSAVLVNTLSSVWNFVIGTIISIYVLLNKELFAAQAKKIVYSLLPVKKANQLIKDTRFISSTFIGFLSGKITDSMIIGVLCFAVLSILKMPYTVLISVIIGITNIIPFFGPFIGAVPCALLVFMIDPKQCITFIIFIVILQQIDGNVIGPLILGDSTGLSGFWVIFSITLFGGLWGVLGMLIGIPFFAVIYAIIKRRVERRLKIKGLPQDTNAYKPLKRIDENGSFVELFEANEINFKKDINKTITKESVKNYLLSLFKKKKKNTFDEDSENEE